MVPPLRGDNRSQVGGTGDGKHLYGVWHLYTCHMIKYICHMIVYLHTIVYTGHMIVYTHHMIVYTRHMIVYTCHMTCHMFILKILNS